MAELVRLLLFPALVVVAWLWSRQSPVFTRNLARQLSYTLAAIVAFIVVTGLYHSEKSAARIHLWVGHAFTSVVWLFVPFAIGIVFQQAIRPRSVAAIVKCFNLLLFLGITLLAAITGYLGPTHQQDIGEESYNRFVVL